MYINRKQDFEKKFDKNKLGSAPFASLCGHVTFLCLSG